MAPRAGIRDPKQINGLERLPGTKAHIDTKRLSAPLANLYRPPPDYESESPGAVPKATGAEVQSVLERTTQTYRKPDDNVQSAAPGMEPSAFSQPRNSHVRRRYDPQRAVARPLIRSDRAGLSRCDRNIRKRAACLRAAKFLIVVPSTNNWPRNRYVPMLDGGRPFEVALTSEQVREANAALRPDGDVTGRLEPHQNTVETEATTPASDMVALLLAVAASAEHGAAP